jgi:hypothetical protein
MSLKTTRPVIVIKRNQRESLADEDEAPSLQLKTPGQVRAEIAGVVLSWVTQRKNLSWHRSKKKLEPLKVGCE